MNWLFSWLIAILVTLPVALRAGDIHGKPVDFVGSDFLFLCLFFIPRRRDLVIPAGVVLHRLALVRVAALATFLYCIGLSAMAYAETSELSRVVSAIKFAKPLAFVLLGSYFAAVMSPIVLLHRIALAFAGVSLVTFATAAVSPGFPHVALGKIFLGFPVYGYRNSAMTFYAIMAPLLLAAADATSTKSGRWTLRGTAVITAMIVITSLSRSSSIVLVIGILIYLYLTGRILWPLMSVILAGVVLVACSGAIESITGNQDVMMWVDRFKARFTQTVGGEDPYAGRGEIWELTINLWADKPILGYAFEPFSNYAAYDTTHQQYLEILFKSGALGAVLYGCVLLASLLGLRHLARFSTRGTIPWYYLHALTATFVAIMIGNLSQPNLTYSITGNLLMLAIGLTMNKHGAAALLVQTQPAGRVTSAGTDLSRGLETQRPRQSPELQGGVSAHRMATAVLESKSRPAGRQG